MQVFRPLSVLVFLLVCVPVATAQDATAVVPLYEGSDLVFDDDIGFETLYYLTDETSVASIDGMIRRYFCSAPEDVSTFEIIKNYEQAIKSKNGQVIHLSRDASSYVDPDTDEAVDFMDDYFRRGRVDDRLLSNTDLWAFANLPAEAEDYVVGKVSSGGKEVYISVAAAVFSNIPYYELVTVFVEPMTMDKVTLDALNAGMGESGRVAIYNIFFDTGKSEIKDESRAALQVVADYLKANPEREFLIVGHTDSVGRFPANLELSRQRAEAVIAALVDDHGIDTAQLHAFGAGSACPQMSNATEEGKARNRRVELVEF